jgi:transposase
MRVRERKEPSYERNCKSSSIGGIPPAAPSGKPKKAIKRYEEAFKRQAVESWIKSGRAGAQIARELGVSYACLKDWKRRYYGDAMPSHPDLAAENRALKAELARVRQQRDILKKTLGILSEAPKNGSNALTP